MQAEEERARHDRNAEDARRVPSLEKRRIGELERDLQRASRRLELFSNAGKPAQNGHTEKRPPLTILEDRVVLRVFSFLVAPEVLATAQSERRFGRVDQAPFPQLADRAEIADDGLAPEERRSQFADRGRHRLETVAV